FNINDDVAIKLFNEYGAEYIEQKIAMIIQGISSRPDKKVDNIAGLIVSAITKNYEQPKSNRQIVEEDYRKKLEQDIKHRIEQKKHDDFNKRYQEYKDRIVSEYIKSQSE